MTLQNGMIADGKAYLWSDTAYFHPDGRTLAGLDAKVMYGEQWPYAVSWSCLNGATGPRTMAERIATAQPASVRDLLAISVTALREFCAAPSAYGQLLIGAYDRQAGEARLFLIRSQEAADEPAFVPIELYGFLSSHQDSAAGQALARDGFTLPGVMAAIETQRTTPADGPLGLDTCHIAGDCVQVEVSADGARMAVIRQWGVVGLPYEPV